MLVVATALTLAGCGSGNADESAGTLTKAKAADTLPISDDFSGECTWPEEETGGAVLSCEAGQYRLLFKQDSGHTVPRRTNTGYEAVAVEATTTLAGRGLAKNEGALQGVGCWASASGEPAFGYAFLLGTAGDGSRAYVIARNDESNEDLAPQYYLDPLVEKQSDSLPPANEPTELRAECSEHGRKVDLALYVNGEKAVSFTDKVTSIQPFIAYGFYGASTQEGVEMRYDDFRVTELD